MNLIEKLQQRIQKKLPDVTAQVDRPTSPEGLWCLDLRKDNQLIVVEWRPGKGFGISAGTGGYGEGPDELYGTLAAVEARLRDLLDSGEESIPPHSVLVQRLRELRGFTQEQLADRMGIRQATVSRIERGDMYLSTLSRLVASMGGKLQMQAVFPDSIIPLDEPAAEVRVTSSKAPRKRSKAFRAP